MFFIDGTKKNGGVLVWGDADTLEDLYTFTHKCWKSPYITDESLKEVLFAFSYDIRKTFDGYREVTSFKDRNNNDLSIYGVQISWLLFLLSITYMRHCLAYLTTNKKDLSIMYLLEYYAEINLNSSYPKHYRLINSVLNQLLFHDQEDLADNFCSRESYFLQLSTKSKRTSQLLHILQTLIPKQVASDEQLLSIMQAIIVNDATYPENIRW